MMVRAAHWVHGETCCLGTKTPSLAGKDSQMDGYILELLHTDLDDTRGGGGGFTTGTKFSPRRFSAQQKGLGMKSSF